MKSWITISTALLLVLNTGTVFAKKDRVLVCHKGKDKQVNENALKGHLGHGDTLGACGSMQIQNGQQTLYNQAVVVTSGAAASQIQQQPLSLQQILEQLAQQSALSASATQTHTTQTQASMPWQPLQGQMAYQYRYYPSASMYYDEGRNLYFYQQNGQWVQTQTIPSGLQTLVNSYVPMQMNTNLPYTYHPQVSQTYTVGTIGAQSSGQAASQQTTTITQKRTVVTQTSTGTGIEQNQLQMPSVGADVTGNVQQGTSQQMSINQKVTQTNSSGQVQSINTVPTVGTTQVITATTGQVGQMGAVPANNVGGGMQLLQTLQALQGFLNQQPAASAQVTGSTQVTGSSTGSSQVTGQTAGSISQLQPDQLQYMLQTLQTIQQNPTAQAGMNAAQQQTLQNTLQQVISTLQQNAGLPIAGKGAAVQTTTTTVTKESMTTTTSGASSNTSTQKKLKKYDSKQYKYESKHNKHKDKHRHYDKGKGGKGKGKDK